jgi:hypothetical protein
MLCQSLVVCLIVAVSNCHGFTARAVPKFDLQQSFKKWFSLPSSLSPKKLAVPAVDVTIYDADITAATKLLVEASTTKKTAGDEVIASLLALEKLKRARNKLDEGETSRDTLENLNGSWRLIFTTGTIDTQKKIGGKINYFPIKAVQTFNTADFSISNGIYLGDIVIIKFYGDFEWLEKARKVEFDFDRIALFGESLSFDLPKGGAAKIGSSTGLGSENNVELITKQNKKPFFNWISADADIATARGGGGGLALWKRVVE